jgi:hypothetical protein
MSLSCCIWPKCVKSFCLSCMDKVNDEANVVVLKARAGVSEAFEAGDYQRLSPNRLHGRRGIKACRAFERKWSYRRGWLSSSSVDDWSSQASIEIEFKFRRPSDQIRRSGKTSCTQVVFSGTVPKDTFFGQQTQEVEKSKFKYVRISA